MKIIVMDNFIEKLEELQFQSWKLTDEAKKQRREEIDDLIKETFNLRADIKYFGYGKYFDNDKQERHIYNITLIRNRTNEKYDFKFGQSIAAGKTPPTLYDCIACLTTFDPGTFNDFCRDFGFDTDSRKAEKLYFDICSEWDNMRRLFTYDELEILNQISR